MDRWAEGDTILLREVCRGRVWTARPVRVVRDGPDVLALHLAPGTRWKGPATRDGERLRVPTDGWVLADREWRFTDALILWVPPAAHTVWAMWERATGRFRGWYVNLQEPLRRTEMGFDYMDHMLDLMLPPDRSSIGWKDRHELDLMRDRGFLGDEEHAGVLAEADRASANARAGGPPFDGDWEGWIASGLPPPKLPAGWDGVDGASPSKG
ncbi:MAG TPA: DUF402 domain-containing protein [Actinomycetota bacterium]|nr:DUF402 domain-containing protein [Actinomycetota bacterium]